MTPAFRQRIEEMELRHGIKVAGKCTMPELMQATHDNGLEIVALENTSAQILTEKACSDDKARQREASLNPTSP